MVVGPVCKFQFHKANGMLSPHGIRKTEAGVEVAAQVGRSPRQQPPQVPWCDDGARWVVAIEQDKVAPCVSI